MAHAPDNNGRIRRLHVFGMGKSAPRHFAQTGDDTV